MYLKYFIINLGIIKVSRNDSTYINQAKTTLNEVGSSNDHTSTHKSSDINFCVKKRVFYSTKDIQ